MSRKFLQELEARRAESRARGRKKGVTADGLTVRERLDLLLDKGTFQEFAPFLARRLDKDPSDGGVIAGFGKVEGRRVAVFAQDSSRGQASLSEMGAQKVGQVIERARMGGLPVVGLYDASGPCPEEGAHGLSGPAELLWQQTQTSGLTPQIAVVVGPASGVLALSVGLADFIVAAGEGHVFLEPETVPPGTGAPDVAVWEGAGLYGREAGLAHFFVDGETEALSLTRRPPINRVLLCVLGRHRRLVRRLEWLTLCPNCGVLPQISHLPGIPCTPSGVDFSITVCNYTMNRPP